MPEFQDFVSELDDIEGRAGLRFFSRKANEVIDSMEKIVTRYGSLSPVNTMRESAGIPVKIPKT